MIGQDLLDELALILEEDYGLNLSRKELSEIGISLISVFKILGQMQTEIETKQT